MGSTIVLEYSDYIDPKEKDSVAFPAINEPFSISLQCTERNNEESQFYLIDIDPSKIKSGIRQIEHVEEGEDGDKWKINVFSLTEAYKNKNMLVYKYDSKNKKFDIATFEKISGVRHIYFFIDSLIHLPEYSQLQKALGISSHEHYSNLCTRCHRRRQYKN